MIKNITSHYKRLALIECACCRESHTVELIKNQNMSIDFIFKEEKQPFLFYLKNFFRVKKEIKKDINYCDNALLLYYDQVISLIDLLKSEGYKTADKDTFNDSHLYAEIEKDYSEKFTAEFFELGYLIEEDSLKDITWKSIWRYITQDNSVSLEKNDIELFMARMETYLNYFEKKLLKEKEK